MQNALDENGTDANASGTGTLIVEFENGRTYVIDQNGNITGPLTVPEETEEPETGGSINTMLYGVIEIKWLMGDTNFVSETANAPVIKTDIPNTTMKLVKYENGNWVEGADYNYKAGNGTEDNRESRWANAEVEIDYGEGNQKIKSYFVWIPRYAYRIIYFNNDTSKAEYLNGTKTEDEAIKEGKIIGYSDSRGIVSIDKEGNVKKVSGTTSLNIGGNYFRVHPAFIDDSKNNYENGGWDSELPGIWVGKYETSLENKKTGSNYDPSSTMIVDENSEYAIIVEQNKRSWRCATIGNQYTSARAYNTNLNSHMLKNIEWGALAYLSKSKYGRNGGEIALNESGGYITANTGISEHQDQSTTGNVYGIYDLSGGAWKYVAAYLEEESTSNENSLLNEKDKKFLTIYTGENVRTDYKAGDATYETKEISSNGGMFAFVRKYYPFFKRGKMRTSGLPNFLDYMYMEDEELYSLTRFNSFRMCLAIK